MMPYLMPFFEVLATALVSTQSTNTFSHLEKPVSYRLSERSRATAEHILKKKDNNDLPFIIVNKNVSEVAIFNNHGDLKDVAPALLGMAIGDTAEHDIGDKDFSHIASEQKITQSGRFFAHFGTSDGIDDVLWIDFRSSLSLHPVIVGNPSEQRLHRLMSPTPDDNRITFGCINVTPEFYFKTLKVIFSNGAGMVYILPETSSKSTLILDDNE